MSLDSIVRKGVKTIDKITKSLQPEVTILQWVGSGDGYGSPGSIKTVKYRAVVEEGDQPRRLPNGLEVMTVAYLIIIQPVKPNGASGRDEPIDGRDIFILPSGLKASVAASRGVDDSKTKKQYYHEVWLGRKL